jgi:hypothetical protein
MCPSHQKISFGNLPGIRMVYWCIAPNGFRTDATALRGRSAGRWMKLDNLESPGFAGSERLFALAGDDRF